MELINLSKERLCEIANLALHGMLEDDAESGMIFIKETINMSKEEMKYFDIGSNKDSI